ncbi:MAG: cofactor assembly of complex C subunit B [Cyanobium sp. LacPavin_0818_WC50_MAG_67_9]|nr:cofactor assembly of complex C subunit B [Cyanobium sp. LacPavin_0818_WC50_MAG_67_9]
MVNLGSTLLLTLLLAIGLVFFLRAASKDRTTVVDVRSSRPPLEVLSQLSDWLQQRGWQTESSDPERRHLCFRAEVAASPWLAVLLSVLGAVGAACLGLIYRNRAMRAETLELRLISHDSATGSALRLRAHRDELIALELELGPQLGLFSDGKLLSSPI